MCKHCSNNIMLQHHLPWMIGTSKFDTLGTRVLWSGKPGKLEKRVQSTSAHPQNFPSLDSMALICNSISNRGKEKALPQFRQGSGPVTSCIHACSGSDRHVIPLGWGITKITHKQIHILKTGNNSVWFSDREVFNRESEYTSSLYRRSDVTPGGSTTNPI